MYSFPYLEPVCCSMSTSNCCFLTCIQISQEAGKVVWYSHLLKNFPQFVVMHTVKGFGIINKAEVDVFLELSCFFSDPANVGNLISGSSSFFKSSLNIWKFTVHILLKSGLENFEHYFAGVWDECNHVVVWAFFGRFFTTVPLGKPAMYLPCVFKVFKSALEHLYIDLVPVVFSEKVNTVSTFIYIIWKLCYEFISKKVHSSWYNETHHLHCSWPCFFHLTQRAFYLCVTAVMFRCINVPYIYLSTPLLMDGLP